MRSIALSLLLVLSGALFAASAVAQTGGVRPFPLRPGTTTTNAQSKVVISVSYQFFIDGKTQNLSEQARLSDEGRKNLYRLLARECEVLLDTIAKECAIHRANVTSRVQNYRYGRDGIHISGSATYHIELKPTRRSPAPERR